MAERTFLATPISAAGGRIIASPFQFLVDGADHLRIEGWNAVAGARLEVTYRFAGLDGRLRVERRELALTANRLVAEVDVPLQPGYLVNLAIFVVGATPLIGQTFTCVKLIRGLGAATIIVGLLVQGYVGAEQGLGWPGSPIADSISGGGVVRTIDGTDPAAGIEISESVPTGARWDLLSVTADFTSAAGGATRVPKVRGLDGVGVMFQVGPAAGHPPSIFRTHTWAQNLPLIDSADGGMMQQALPSPSLLQAGQSFVTVTSNLAAGDQWDNPMYVVREWLEAN